MVIEETAGVAGGHRPSPVRGRSTGVGVPGFDRVSKIQRPIPTAGRFSCAASSAPLKACDGARVPVAGVPPALPRLRPAGGPPPRPRRSAGPLDPTSSEEQIDVSYLSPAEFVTKAVDAGESKVFMSSRDTLIRAGMAGAILALAAAFAVTISVQTGQPLAGAVLFPVGFVLLYLLGFDLLTGVFVLTPLALIDRRPGVTVRGVLRNWGLVFVGNYIGALLVALLMAITFTFAFREAPNEVGQAIGQIGVKRTVGYHDEGLAGMLTLFTRGMLCNWMVATGVIAALISTSVSGKVIAMWMPIMLFFYMGFEHSVVNMFLFPSGLMLGADFTLRDYLLWNELPTVVGNLVGGMAFVGLTLYTTHVRTAPSRREPVIERSEAFSKVAA
jgi:formate/nitrite transporter